MKYQVAIIGGGPAGYTAAEAAGKAGLSVVLFEKRSLGGVCLNEGCIPTKAFCRNPAGFLLRLSLTVLSQKLHSGIHITVGFSQSLFAVHHTCAGHFS